ncbi:MAG: hypothetical protein A4E65_02345 [Syntrophorhabdus sp. PtaU1.Bin153]|nr:MAG: hypothetical protein A4E65_02345 [Syntrophorhabdus sp. PtaU1.Bin153]
MVLDKGLFHGLLVWGHLETLDEAGVDPDPEDIEYKKTGHRIERNLPFFPD